MKPPVFGYVRAQSIAHASALLAEVSGEALLLAGGQTLGALLNLRVASPELLIDIGHIGEMGAIEWHAKHLAIGAGVTHAMLEDWNDLSPLGSYLRRIAGGIAYRAIRNRGTIGGSLAYADPAADWVSAMMLLDATVVLSGATARRRVPMSGFIRGPFATCREPTEVIAAIELQPLSEEARWGYYRVSRKFGEFPDAIGAVLFDPPRKLARVLCGALDTTPQLLPEVAASVARSGTVPEIDAVAAALSRLVPSGDPIDRRCHAVAVCRAIIDALE